MYGCCTCISIYKFVGGGWCVCVIPCVYVFMDVYMCVCACVDICISHLPGRVLEDQRSDLS